MASSLWHIYRVIGLGGSINRSLQCQNAKQCPECRWKAEKSTCLPSIMKTPFGLWSKYVAEYLQKSGSVGLLILPCFIAQNAQPVTEGSVIICEYYLVTTQIIRYTYACIHSSVVVRHERYKLPIKPSFCCFQVTKPSLPFSTSFEETIADLLLDAISVF